MKIFISFIVLFTVLLSGCTKMNMDEEKNKSVYYQVEYESEDHDGTVSYLVDGKEYRYLLEVTGRSNNAVQDSYYILLSNRKSITFQDANQQYYGSDLSLFGDFIIVESGLLEGL